MSPRSCESGDDSQVRASRSENATLSRIILCTPPKAQPTKMETPMSVRHLVKPVFIESDDSLCLVEPAEPKDMQKPKHRGQHDATHQLGAAGNSLEPPSERGRLTAEEADLALARSQSVTVQLTSTQQTESAPEAACSMHNPPATVRFGEVQSMVGLEVLQKSRVYECQSASRRPSDPGDTSSEHGEPKEKFPCKVRCGHVCSVWLFFFCEFFA